MVLDSVRVGRFQVEGVFIVVGIVIVLGVVEDWIWVIGFREHPDD